MNVKSCCAKYYLYSDTETTCYLHIKTSLRERLSPCMHVICQALNIANAFNNYFASIVETMNKSIKYSHFSDYHANKNGSTIFLQPTDNEEIANIISSLNSNKVSGPNSIPYKILFLLKNEISK